MLNKGVLIMQFPIAAAQIAGATKQTYCENTQFYCISATYVACREHFKTISGLDFGNGCLLV